MFDLVTQIVESFRWVSTVKVSLCKSVFDVIKNKSSNETKSEQATSRTFNMHMGGWEVENFFSRAAYKPGSWKEIPLGWLRDGWHVKQMNE